MFSDYPFSTNIITLIHDIVNLSFFFFRFNMATDFSILLISKNQLLLSLILFLFSISLVSTLTYYFPFCTHFGFHLLLFLFFKMNG